MSFHTYHSHRVEHLRDDLIDRMFADLPQGQLFAPEQVLVDNRVLGDWLNMEIARSRGIAANIHYLQPHELFWDLARKLLGEAAVPKETPLSKAEMSWKLYGLLGDESLLDQADLLPVKNYLQGEPSSAADEVALKRHQLSTSIADLFDQYLVYRPDWINSWSKGKAISAPHWPSNDTDNEKWQRLLWQALSASSSHRAAIEEALLTELHGGARLKEKIGRQRLFVFGMTSMPPKLVEMLMLLGKHIEVAVYVLNPCEEYWSLIRDARSLAKKDEIALEDMHYEVGNPLLASLGVQVRDFISLMQDKGDDDPVLLFDLNDNLGDNLDKAPETLLEQIQREIRTLSPPEAAAREEDAAAIPSVHIHQCHSEMREVEVLHDQLRDMLAQNPGMNPRDIVVMMPRVAPYVGAIHAVFNSVAAKDRLDYHITDRTQAEESPLLNSFISLLQLPDSRLPLSDVMALLEVPALQRRFGLDADAYATLKRWLVDSGVRWGLNALHRQQLGLPAYGEASWQFGRDRLLAGYAFHADAAAASPLLALNGLAVHPYDHIEGGNSELLNSFLLFWSKLEKWRKALGESATAAAWAEKLRALLEDFFEAGEEQEHIALKAARECIHALDEVHEKQWYSGEIPLRVLRDVVKPALQKSASSQNPWQEGIKFCSLMPMRGVPFQVVYILGMNMDDYPRRIDKRSFDLMRLAHRRGDRASRIDDRWLFLEALLSARQYFHVSYIARDIHRNEKREPSVVLSELLAYCHNDKRLLTAHPLQPFSNAYFVEPAAKASGRLVSFNNEACQIANARSQQQVADHACGEERWQGKGAKESVEPLHLSQQEFIRFFTKPWDWFFKNKHRVYLEVEDHGVDDDENLEAPDGLLQWGLRDELIKRVQGGAAPDAAIEALVKQRQAEGSWPLAAAGEEAKQNLKGLATDYVSASRDFVKSSGHTVGIGSGQHRLAIEVDMMLDAEKNTLLFHSASKKKAAHELEFYIRTALALEAIPTLRSARALFYESSTKQGYRDISLALSDAEQQSNRDFLALLASCYRQYRETGLPFEPELGKALADLPEDGDADELIEEAWNKEKSEWSAGGMAADSKQRAYFGRIEAISSDVFQSSCRNLWRAVYQRFPEVKPADDNKKKKGKAS